MTYQFSNPVEYEVNLILSDSVVPASIVISSILFAGYQLLRVKQTAVCAGANFICAGAKVGYFTISSVAHKSTRVTKSQNITFKNIHISI